jgi:thymidylate kinase
MRIVFEGLPGAGKTNLINNLANTLSIPVIPEFACLSESNWRNYRLTKPFYQANDEAKEFIGSLIADKVVFFDRHYASTLAYGYALSACFGSDLASGESYRVNYEWYKRCILDRKLTFPDLVFLIDISPMTSRKRKPNAGKIDYVWGSENSLSAVRFYYRQFYELIEPQVEVILIDGEASEDRVLDSVRQHLSIHITH